MIKEHRTYPVWKDWSRWKTSPLPGEDRAAGHLITVLLYLNDRILQRGWRLPPHRCQTESTRGNGYKLKQERFPTDGKKHFLFSVRALIYWNNLLWDMVKSPFLKTFRMQLRRVVDIFIEVLFPTKAWAGRSFEAPSHLGCFVILWTNIRKYFLDFQTLIQCHNPFIFFLIQKQLKPQAKLLGNCSMLIKQLV